MTKEEVLKMALEALYALAAMNHTTQQMKSNAITAIKEALAQPEQEPVAWVSTTELVVMRGNALGGAKDWRINLGLVKQDGDVGLYTTPPQRKPLTDEEVNKLVDDEDWYNDPHGFVRAIEAAHGIKE